MRTAFTLVELLVVVTIVVVLLALLTPAMDQAVYQAELAVCGARLKAIAGGMTGYAGDFKRHYPYNRSHANSLDNWHPPLMRFGTIDLRPIFAPYLPINQTFIDPMIPSMDVAAATENSVYGTYSLWNGWRWTPDTYGTQMRQAKIGDRFNWKGENGSGPEVRWDILASDFMRADVADATNHVPDGGYWSSHPSTRGTSRLEHQSAASTGVNLFYSFWRSVKIARDEVDYNLTRQDNSVQFLRGTTWNDERLIDVPEFTGGPGTAFLYHQMPMH